jgi:hypothetical protein
VDTTHPIRAPNGRQLDELTHLRARASRRAAMRRQLQREMRWAFAVYDYVISGLLFNRDHLRNLIRQLWELWEILRAQEERDRVREARIWESV